uniref:Dof zinc finger protein n=1 Tax=Ananas comosus var. bracteatus TaxID=296719 RepID=A0A6V7PDF3_ANACO|nr:unnamed protein product [Ananas comosus var. bracteatus]
MGSSTLPLEEVLASCPKPQQQERKVVRPQPEQSLKCPRCESTNTKFCYYNNYSLSQPRYFCKGCRRYWTKGGSLRNVPVGGGCRKNKRSSSNSSSNSSSTSPSNSSSSSKRPQDHHQTHLMITTSSMITPSLSTLFPLTSCLMTPVILVWPLQGSTSSLQQHQESWGLPIMNMIPASCCLQTLTLTLTLTQVLAA